MNKQELEYFKTHWKPRWDNKKYSGWALLTKLKPTDNILDIGCGNNPLKEKFGDRVYGIDPTGLGRTDEAVSIEDFEPKQKFNVFLCLGSINFGTAEEIEKQLEKITSMTETGDRIYWRQNTYGDDHPWHEESSKVRFFAWSREKNQQYCDKYNYKLNDIQDDAPNRLYAEWIKQ